MNKKTDTILTVADAGIGGTVKTAGRRKIKRMAAEAGGMDLLKVAAKVRGQLDIADAGPSKKERALTAIGHLEDKAPTWSDSILMVQFVMETGRGEYGEDEGFAAIASFAEEIAWEDQEINRLSKAIDDKHKEAGMTEDETWPDGEGPEDVEALRAAWDSRFLQLRVAILRRHDENEMADLLMNDPDAFQDRVEKGQKIFEERKGGK